MLSRFEIERYSRQILCIGQTGQETLKNARLLVLGAGGLGSSLLPTLATSGVGHITLYEPDVVETSNLARQTLYTPDDVGLPKGAVAVNALTRMNPDLDIRWLSERFIGSIWGRAESAMSPGMGSVEKKFDLIIDGTDDINCKFLVSDFSVKHKIPAIIGAIGPRQGHVFPLQPGGACYRCVFECPPDPGLIPTCSTEGILSPLPAVIGSFMAYLTISFLLKGTFSARLNLFDDGQWRSIDLKKNPDCVCA